MIDEYRGLLGVSMNLPAGMEAALLAAILQSSDNPYRDPASLFQFAVQADIKTDEQLIADLNAAMEFENRFHQKLIATALQMVKDSGPLIAEEATLLKVRYLQLKPLFYPRVPRY